jgi:glycosyl transferase family 25
MSAGIAGQRAAGGAFPFDCHVINLAKTPERMATFLGQNSGSGLNFARFEAVDGNTLSEDEAIRIGLIKPRTKWRSKGTLGVAQSHRRLWEKAIAENRALIVFEDDAYIRDDFRQVFAAANARLADWDIVLCGYNTDALVEFNVAADFDMSSLFSVRYPSVEQLVRFVRSRGPVSLFRLRYAFGISGYAISPAGAKKLLARCFPMDNRLIEFRAAKNRFNAFSIDCMMNIFYRDLEAYVFVGPLVLPHNEVATSTVDRGKR